MELKFNEWLLLEKYMNNESSRCGWCGKYLTVQSMTVHSPASSEIQKHIYEIGQLLVCNCGKSKIWTNSVRSEQRLLNAILQNNPGSYYNGFCNDKFCGYCYGPIDVLKNGELPSWEKYQRMDRYGCRDKHLTQCQENNQNIFFVPHKEDQMPNRILDWYIRHFDQFKALVRMIGGDL